MVLRIWATSALTIAAARVAVGAPYIAGDLSVVADEGCLSYAGSSPDGNAAYRLMVRPAGLLAFQSPLEIWLTGRWRAYTRHAGVLLQSPIEHPPWPLAAATAPEVFQTVTAAVGLPPPAGRRWCSSLEESRYGWGLSRPAHLLG